MWRTTPLPAALLVAVAASADAPLPALEWIAGHWCARDGDRVIEELWLPPHRGVVIGMGRTRTPLRTSAFEYLRIVIADGKQSYVAQPGGSPPTNFHRTAGGADWARFENPDHDFPQRVEYRRDGSRLKAEVAGPGDDGEEIVIGFDYERCEATGDADRNPR